MANKLWFILSMQVVCILKTLCMQSNMIPDKSWDHSVISTKQKRHSLKSNIHSQFQKLSKTIRTRSKLSQVNFIPPPPPSRSVNKARMPTLLLSMVLEVLVREIRRGKKKRGRRNEVQSMTKINERRKGVKGKGKRTQTWKHTPICRHCDS